VCAGKGKLRKKKCGRKSATEKCVGKATRKSAAEKPQQKKCDRKITAVDLQQQNCGKKCYKKKKGYGFHMCSVEFMNQVEGFPCKNVGCPLGSLWLVVELI
jgi:hypothetical protein